MKNFVTFYSFSRIEIHSLSFLNFFRAGLLGWLFLLPLSASDEEAKRVTKAIDLDPNDAVA